MLLIVGRYKLFKLDENLQQSKEKSAAIQQDIVDERKKLQEAKERNATLDQRIAQLQSRKEMALHKFRSNDTGNHNLCLGMQLASNTPAVLLGTVVCGVLENAVDMACNALSLQQSRCQTILQQEQIYGRLMF